MKSSRTFKTPRFMACLAVMALAAFTPGAQAAELGLGTLVKWLPLLLQGFAVDVGISVAAMAIGTVLGALLGIGQISQLSLIRKLSDWITQFFRNAPWLVLLFFCILLLPYQITLLGSTISFPAWAKGIIGLMLPVMGNVSEVVRGGIQSIPSGQWEAANALAFSRGQTLRMIILPQTVKRMVPPWMNVYAVLMMATPLVSIVGVEDSVTVARAVLSAENNTALLMPVYGLLLLLFFAYCYPIARWTRKLEKRYAIA
ncbi:amino acid ABC transporter permease [Pusillimonas sp. SM2304]|uniref:amino acid ABC transporter permease n=1 Tax=Pusillimonas sp. SM2304 TaxID=3073241 RepID=UPI00287434FF|nr:amino acid ABC transporter permease [Pusillimonas sp. SM2304]MDS1138878.1 amino acid ABC transporter permease [Pusillimonas sp. SM2304]